MFWKYIADQAQDGRLNQGPSQCHRSLDEFEIVNRVAAWLTKRTVRIPGRSRELVRMAGVLWTMAIRMGFAYTLT